MTYLLDANVFIQAKNLHYGLDFCPAFWQWLIDQNQANRVFSIDKVADEMNAGADELSDWVKDQSKSLFLKTDQRVATYLSSVSTWVQTQNYEAMAMHAFYQVADYYLIAHALAGSHVLVTHEIPANSLKKIKIPNVCMGLEVSFMTPYEMLRREKARFVLGGV